MPGERVAGRAGARAGCVATTASDRGQRRPHREPQLPSWSRLIRWPTTKSLPSARWVRSAIGSSACSATCHRRPRKPRMPKSSSNCLCASSSMTARSTTSTSRSAKGCRPPARRRTQGTRPALGLELHRDAAHHQSSVPATMAAALELSMATEKIVETQKGFRGQIMSDEGFLQPYMILDDCAGRSGKLGPNSRLC